MSDRNEQVEELKRVFEKAKNAKRDEDGDLSDINLFGELYSALSIIGKEYLLEFKDIVYDYLKDPCSDLRAQAIRTLGWNTRLGLDEFCLNQAPEIWLNDPNEEVKSAALVAWAGYFSRKKDPEMLKILYKILSSNNYSILIRSWAVSLFFSVADGWLNSGESYDNTLRDLEDQEEFDKVLNWDRIHKIMKECVPGWSSADASK